MTRFLLITAILTLAGYLGWRYLWFFRNPPRVAPPGENLVSPADAGRSVFLFLTAAPGNISLPDGRTLPVNLSSFLLFQSLFDAMGEWRVTLPIPNDSNLVGISVYTCYVSFLSGIQGISNSFSLTIQS